MYVSVTANLARRAWEHREGVGSRFASHYGVSRLVYIERHERIDEAIAREKAIKKWNRAWKFELIERGNPDWIDLFDQLNA